MKKIFIIHSLSKTQKAIEYAEELEAICYVPGRDTKQTDTTPEEILTTNRDAMLDCEEVHVMWDLSSLGSVFDMGMAFALDKPIKMAWVREHHWATFAASKVGQYILVR